MSQASDNEQQQAPAARGRGSAPLMARWLRVLVYAVFIPFCIFSVIVIARSTLIQRRMTGAIATLNGAEADTAVALTSPEAEAALGVLRERPRDGFLYLVQELLLPEESDPRRSRSLALRKAVEWERTSTCRELVARVVENMDEEGRVSDDFVIDDQMRATLEEMIAQRRADAEMSYAETLVTDVLEWLAAGHPGEPSGPERRRMQALLHQYEKRRFDGSEARALRRMMEEWEASDEPVAREAARAFAQMLEGQQTALSPEAQALCTERADRWDELYREAMVRLAGIARQMLPQIVREERPLSHPHIYRYLSLLCSEFEGVRREVAEGGWLLRHDRFAVRFLSEFACKTTVNPMMAVETARLTREENERQLGRANRRRMQESVALLGRIGLDYVRHPDEYSFGVEDPDEFVARFIVHALADLRNEEVVGARVRELLAQLRQADEASPNGPKFFGGPAD
jgi:hypothetical protein